MMKVLVDFGFNVPHYIYFTWTEDPNKCYLLDKTTMLKVRTEENQTQAQAIFRIHTALSHGLPFIPFIKMRL